MQESGSWQAFARLPASVRPGRESNPEVIRQRIVSIFPTSAVDTETLSSRRSSDYACWR
jgi:hypothetical protein